MSSDGIKEESQIKAEKNDEEETAKHFNLVEATPQVEEAKGEVEEFHALDESHCIPPLKHEEEVVKRKYGGLLPKKPPLISKDHEHAFFDSADWALGKKSKGLVESLRPKLQPSPHHQTRSRSVYAPSDDDEDGHNSEDVSTEENQLQTLVGGTESKNNTLANQNDEKTPLASHTQ